MQSARPLGSPSWRGCLVAWLAFLIALGPMWPDFFEHVLVEPWAHASLVFAGLFAARVIFGEPAPESARWPRLGLALTLVAALLALAFLGADLARWARLALPLGGLGLALRYGRPALPSALLVLWVLPLPSFALGLLPGLAEGWLAAARGITGIDAPLVVALEDVDAGIGLAWIAAGLGLHAALRLEIGGLRRWLIPFVCAVVAPLLQVLALAAALSLGRDGNETGALFALRELPWMFLVGCGLVLPELARLLPAARKTSRVGVAAAEDTEAWSRPRS